MSEEIFGVVQKLPVNGTKKQVVLQCAPLLTGINVSNLLNVRADQKEEVFKLFEGSPVCCRVLYEFRGRLSILLYRPGMLRAYLEREDVKRLMASFGYEDLGLEETLDRIAEGYQEHMDGKLGFPHEIGLVLGYPPVDVEGFIKKGGRDFLYSGYWKVYGNLEDALKTFEAYDRARDYVISMTGNGYPGGILSTAGSNNKKAVDGEVRITAKQISGGNKKMDKVIVAYWSQTGNTAAMAAAIGEGITEAGKEAVVTDISSVSMDDLQAASAFALGCPAMGAEVLEEGEMEPFVTEVEAFASGKKIGLFGSYGWGDGQWMRDWEDRMKAAGATVVGGEGVICQETPDDEALENCKALGKELAALA